jgi:carbamoyltransferase
MIKCRDFWMPFAASLRLERAADYLFNPKGVDAPYMIMCFDTLPERRAELAAASHPYDHTVRPQVVRESWNPAYCRLLRHFEALTGIGGVLNTSFNLHGSPLVCTPADAVAVFRESGLRHLAIGSFLVSKDRDAGQTAHAATPATVEDWSHTAATPVQSMPAGLGGEVLRMETANGREPP